MRALIRRTLIASAALLAAGCATVKSQHVAPDYDSRYKDEVKRLAVLTDPVSAKDVALSPLWSLVARKYVNQKFDYIVKRTPEAATATAPEALCSAMQGDDKIDGVLWLSPRELPNGDEVHASVTARIQACGGGEVWSAEGEGTWDSDDDQLKSTTDDYVQALTPNVRPYVAPTFRILKSVLDTLPEPAKLTDDETDEKIAVMAD